MNMTSMHRIPKTEPLLDLLGLEYMEHLPSSLLPPYAVLYFPSVIRFSCCSSAPLFCGKLATDTLIDVGQQ